MKLKYWSTQPVFRITVDGKTWFATGFWDDWYYIPARFMQANLVGNNRKLKPKFSGKCFWNMKEQFARVGTEIISVYDGWTHDSIDGKFVNGSIGWAIHLYLNEISVEDCLCLNGGFCNILALLDYRLGKRRIRKMLETMDNYPKFWHRWIKLRAEAEGLLRRKEESA